MDGEDDILGIQLVTAAATGMLEMVDAALAAGADLHYNNDLALRSAVFTGNSHIAKHLIEKGADIHASAEEALLYAAKRRDDDLVRLLLDKGASIAVMMSAHKKEVDRDCLETLDGHESSKLREAFEANFSKLKKPEAGQKFRLPKKPPSP